MKTQHTKAAFILTYGTCNLVTARQSYFTREYLKIDEFEKERAGIESNAGTREIMLFCRILLRKSCKTKHFCFF
jgi:hypothetical protein